MSLKRKGLDDLNNNKEKSADIKLLIVGCVIIILIFAIIYSYIYYINPKEPEEDFPYPIPILDENGKVVNGIPYVPDGIKIENVTVNLINRTSTISSSHSLSEKTFVCSNTSFTLTYVDDNNDGLFNRGDYMIVSGQMSGSEVRFINSNGKSIALVIFS